MDCLTDELLARVVTNTLSTGLLDEVTAHAVACAPCGRRLQYVLVHNDVLHRCLTEEKMKDVLARPSSYAGLLEEIRQCPRCNGIMSAAINN